LSDGTTQRVSYLQRWRLLSQPAQLYLLHAALLTFSLAILGLFFNFTILALGFPLEFLGLLNTISFAAATVLGVPLLWLATRVSLRLVLIASAGLQLISTLIFAVAAASTPLLVAGALTGVAAVLFDVGASPFMMRYSAAATRDHLFSANAAIRIGLAGVGSLVAGQLPGLSARLLGVAPGSAAAYQATLVVAAIGVALAIVPLLLIRREGVVAETAVAPSASPGDARSTRLPVAPRAQRSVIPATWREIARHPLPLLKLLASPALISVGAALLIPYLNLFFKQRFEVGDQALGAIFATLGIATGIASLLGPALSTRIGTIQTVVLTQALALPFLAVLGIAPLLSIAIGAALVRAALFNMGTPLYDAFAMEQTDEGARPVVIGVLNGAASLGYAFAPLVSVQIQAAYGFGPIFAITTACYILAVLAKYWFFMRASRA
jgi:MFS family permease